MWSISRWWGRTCRPDQLLSPEPYALACRQCSIKPGQGRNTAPCPGGPWWISGPIGLNRKSPEKSGLFCEIRADGTDLLFANHIPDHEFGLFVSPRCRP